MLSIEQIYQLSDQLSSSIDSFLQNSEKAIVTI
jgi:hypothetical protein